MVVCSIPDKPLAAALIPNRNRRRVSFPSLFQEAGEGDRW
jgi:hypothetical protein